MRILYLEFLILFIYGVLANERYIANERSAKCSASRLCPLKVEYRNSTLSNIELGDHKYYQCCSSSGYCGETIEYCGEGCRFGACLNDLDMANDSSECKALNERGECNADCPCADGAECSENGFCMSPVLDKRHSCSYLRDKGRCSSDCPCKRKGECCSEYGYCGTSSSFCGSSKKKSESSKVTVRTTSSPGIVIYLPSYRLDSEINIKKFDFRRINVLNYCFFQFHSNGEAYAGNYEMDIKNRMVKYVTHDLRKKYPHLKIIVTVGGTKGSKNFKYVLGQSSSRYKAAKTIAKVVDDYRFDGVDIDWEFPETESEANSLLSFIKKIREYMGYDKYLTLSASPLISRYHGLTSVMEPYLNWFNLMTYHYSGYWDKYSGYNSPLYPPNSDKNGQKNSDYTVDSYIEAGVPHKKLLLGAPFMGQAWKVVSSSKNGYNQRGNANVRGDSYDPNWEGLWSYRALRKEGILTSRRSTSRKWVRTWHSDVKSPTLFNKSSYTYISYDDVDSMCERAKYVKKKRIGGIMVWETGQDYNRELLDAILDCY